MWGASLIDEMRCSLWEALQEIEREKPKSAAILAAIPIVENATTLASMIKQNSTKLVICAKCQNSTPESTSVKCSSCFTNYCSKKCKVEDFAKHSEECQDKLWERSRKGFISELNHLFDELNLVEQLRQFYTPISLLSPLQVKQAIDVLKSSPDYRYYHYDFGINEDLLLKYKKLKKSNPELANNFAFTLFAVTHGINAYHLPDSVVRIREIAEASIIHKTCRTYIYFDPWNRHHECYAIPREIQHDAEFMRLAFSGYVDYKHLSTTIPIWGEIARAAISKSAKSYLRFLPEIQEQQEFAMLALQHGLHYSELPRAIQEREDREIMKAAIMVSQNVQGLPNYTDLPEYFQEEKEIALLALQNGLYHSHLSKKFKNDRDMAIIIVNKHCFAYEWISEELKEDKAIALLALQKGLPSYSLSKKFKNDKDAAIILVRNDYLSYGWISEELQEDQEIASLAVKSHKRKFPCPLWIPDSIKRAMKVAEGQS